MKNSDQEYPTYEKGADIKGIKATKIFSNNTVEKYTVYKGKTTTVLYASDSRGCIDNIPDFSLIQAEVSTLFFNRDLERILAKSIELALLNKEKEAKSILASLIEKMDAKKVNLKKISFLTIPCISTVLLIICYLILSKFFFEGNKYIFLLKLIILGGMSSYLSIATDINKIEFNTHESFTHYLLFSSFKYISSIFSVIISYFLVKSNVLNVTLGNNITYTYYLFAFLAGFSEKFIPDIFNKIEGQAKGK